MASEVSKPHFVRCPKCRRLLMEIADIPVYQCGGCGTILQTKPRRANMEISYTGCRVEENPPCSTSENKSHEEESNNFSEEEPAACRETADMEAGSTPNIPYSAGRSAVMGVDTISVSSAPQSQLDGSCKLSRHGSANSSSSSKMGECTESVISEEEIFHGNPGNRQIHNVSTSIARSSHAYEGGVSSGDDISGKRERYRLLSRRTFRNRTASESSSTGTRNGKDDTFLGNKQAASSSEMYDAGALGISGLERGSSSRNAAHTSDPDASPGFVNLYPVQNEQESDHLSSLSGSPSRGSTSLEDFPCNGSNGTPSTRLENLQSDRIEPQRRVDLLRDQLSRTYGGGRRGGQRVPVGGRPPLFSNLGSEQVPTALCNGDMSQWQSRSSGRTTIDARYQSSGIPLSTQGNSYCLPHHHHHPDVPGHLPSSIYCRACSSGTCSFHPSTAATSGLPEVDRDASLCHRSEASDYRTGIVPGKEKRHHKKRRHCRPVSGGSPFVVCNECSELLQLPVDFLVSRGRRHKLRCGACSEVLTFLYHGGHVVPLSSAQVDPSPTGVHTSMDDDSKNEQNSLHEDPVSYSEEYGPPPSQSYSTDGEPCILRNSPEQKGKGRYKQRMGSALHHLLGYDSARDLICLPGDEDERYESMDLSSFHIALDYVDDEHYGGTGTGSPAQERPSVGYSPNQSEIQEEEPVMRLAGARGGPPPRGFIRGDTDELNHGLNNMKLRPQKNGRPW